jgi:carbon monoxide dehydrogenase subunit G
MVHVTRTFTVDRPVDVVVAYLADFGNAAEWDPGTAQCTRTDSGAVKVGATWRNTQKVLGMTSELDYRLDRLDPGHVVFVGHNEKASVESTDDITVRPHAADPGRSEVTYDATITFRGLAKLGAPVMQLEFEKLGNQVADGIRQAVAGLPARG